MSGTILFRTLAVCSLLVCASSIHSAAQSGNEIEQLNGQLPPKFVQMLNTQVLWDNGLNSPSGLRLRFVKFEEPTQENGHLTRFRVYADGAASGKPYIFAVWPIGRFLEDLQVLSSTAYVNGKGLLLTKQPRKNQEDQETVSDGTEFDVGVRAANGEPIRFVLRSKDSKVLVPGTLVPFPIESTDHGCKLSALLSVPEGQAILIYGDGFVPNSTVAMNGDSAGELMKKRQTADANGHIQSLELPFVIGKDAGTLKESITTGACSVSISIPWGKGTYQKH